MEENYGGKLLNHLWGQVEAGAPLTIPLAIFIVFLSFKSDKIKEWIIQIADGIRSKEIKEEHERQKKDLMDYIEALKRELNVCEHKIDDLAKSNVFLNKKIDLLSQNLSDLKDQNVALLQLIAEKKKK